MDRDRHRNTPVAPTRKGVTRVARTFYHDPQGRPQPQSGPRAPIRNCGYAREPRSELAPQTTQDRNGPGSSPCSTPRRPSRFPLAGVRRRLRKRDKRINPAGKSAGPAESPRSGGLTRAERPPKNLMLIWSRPRAPRRRFERVWRQVDRVAGTMRPKADASAKQIRSRSQLSRGAGQAHAAQLIGGTYGRRILKSGRSMD